MAGRKGIALILVLGILMIVSLFVTAFLGLMNLETRMAKQFVYRLKAHYLAQAGVEMALAQLARDKNSYDALGGSWRENSNYYRTFPGGGLYDVTWRVRADGQMVSGVEDEAGKININLAKKKVLLNLPGLNEKTVAAIIKDREAKPFITVDEILRVQGISRAVFKGIEELITVNSKGKVNVNTASAQVLASLGLNKDFVRAILNHRRGKDEKDGTADDRPFRKMDEVLNLGNKYGLGPKVLSSLLTVSSNNFSIISLGKIKRGKITVGRSSIRAVVERNAGEVSIKYWWEK
jgi:type II secretory pathway component PulK